MVFLSLIVNKNVKTFVQIFPKMCEVGKLRTKLELWELIPICGFYQFVHTEWSGFTLTLWVIPQSLHIDKSTEINSVL